MEKQTGYYETYDAAQARLDKIQALREEQAYARFLNEYEGSEYTPIDQDPD